MSATPQEIKAAIESEKSGQTKHGPRGVCTLSFVAGDVSEKGMTEAACATAAQVTQAAGMTWVEEKTHHGNGP